MTLPDIDEYEEEKTPVTQSVISQAIEEVVKHGLEEDRVTSGIDQCVHWLGSCPEQVMLCLLAKLTGALPAEVKIQLLLIRAFCQENGIDLLQVDNEAKMADLLSAFHSQSEKVADDIIKPSKVEKSSQFDCLMIKYPKQDTSFEEDLVSDYIKQEMHKHSDPYVALSDMTLTESGKALGIKPKIKKKVC